MKCSCKGGVVTPSSSETVGHSLDREGIEVLDQQLKKVKQEIQHSIFLLKSYSKSQCDSFADNLPGYWLPVQVESISRNFTIFSKHLHPPCVSHIGDQSNKITSFVCHCCKTNNVFAGHKYWLFLSKVGISFLSLNYNSIIPNDDATVNNIV